MTERTPAEELAILRQSVAWLVQEIGVDIPELPVLTMTPDQLVKATKNQSRGWNKLIAKIGLSVEKK